jgi:hypothetical protein
MTALLVLLLLQARQPTVGDTIWAVRRVAVPAGRSVRAAPWELTGDVELLGRPRIVTSGTTAEVGYPLVAWTPGSHTVSVPGPLVLAPDGSVDSLPAADTTFSVASVLPASAADTSLRPQPQAGIVHRRTVTWGPALALAGLALILLAPLHWWWRRRGRRVPLPEAAAPPPLPLARWAAAGESRTVLGVFAGRLRAAAARSGGGVDPAQGEHTRRALDDARFAGASPADVAELSARATALITMLGGAPS